MNIEALVAGQRDYFRTGATLPVAARRAALQKLRQAIWPAGPERRAA